MTDIRELPMGAHKHPVLPTGNRDDKMPVAPIEAGPDGLLTLRCRTVAEGRFRQLNYVRDLPPHAVDEPSELPGTDQAPSPSEALLAALGSSLAMGIHANAVARNIVVQRLVLDVEGDTHATGTEGTRGTGPQAIGFDVIRVTVHLEANAPRGILSAVVAHATLASTVANTLHNPVHLDIALAGT
jgi:uncharacterized OsmC-like protein